MKLCFPTAELRGLDSAMEPHFPHAVAYLIFDTDTRSYQEIPLSEDAPTEQKHDPINIVICGSINRRGLHHLQQHGVQVMGCRAETVAEAIALFERDELRAVPPAQAHDHGQGGCGCGCGGHGHHKHHSHDDSHSHDEHGGCCGGSHDHSHGHGGCCGGGECSCKA